MFNQSLGKITKSFLLIGSITLASISTNVSAAVIDFGTGLAGAGGTISDVNGDGSLITGSDILIGALTAVDTGADGTYTVDALLDFDTGANTIEINGTITSLGINSSITLLSGSFDSWNYDPSPSVAAFSGSGLDVKHPDLLIALGLDANTQFEFFGFSLGFGLDTNGNATAISTDILNTSVIPVPAAVWLFGTGLLGLVGVARRRV